MKRHFFCFATCLILCACREHRQRLTTGEYSHGLQLCTAPDGNFHAWYTPDSSTKQGGNIVFLCIPHTPQANVVAFVAPHSEAATFGILTHLGRDSFRLTFDSLPNDARRFSQTFALRKARPDWLHFYFWGQPDSAFLYKKPTYKSPRIRCAIGAHLYSTDDRAEWLQVQLDSAKYWVRRKDVL
jgi:hypothetical protein